MSGYLAPRQGLRDFCNEKGRFEHEPESMLKSMTGCDFQQHFQWNQCEKYSRMYGTMLTAVKRHILT